MATTSSTYHGPVQSTNSRCLGAFDGSFKASDLDSRPPGESFAGNNPSECSFKLPTPPISPYTVVKSPSDSLLFPTPETSSDYLFNIKQSKSTLDLGSRLHISNLPFRFRNPDLVVLFSKYGTVVDAEIIFNEKGSKGFGFVSMGNPGEASYARAVLQGAIVEGRRIDVNPATAKTTPRPVSALHMKPLQQDVEGQRKLVEAQTRLAELQLALMTLQKDSSQVSFGPANFYC